MKLVCGGHEAGLYLRTQFASKEEKMKLERLVSGLVLGLLLVAAPAFAQGNVQKLKTDEIANAIGKQGEFVGEMYKVSFPRSDLTVNVGNVAIKPALALMAWAAFVKSGNDAFTYGDLVVLEDEANPVIGKLEERGLELSALHNHLLHEIVFHITVPRNDLHVASMGTMIPGSMGMNTPFNFQLDGKNAAINGDFMLRPS